MQKKFPKKAKLITFGGFYKIIPLEKFQAKIHYPFFSRVQVSLSEFLINEMIPYSLIFIYSRVRRGYAEYKQIDFIRLEHLPNKKAA